MYLSLLHVDVRNRPAQDWLRNIYRIHQRLWMAFPDERRLSEDPFFLNPWSGSDIPEPKPSRQSAGFLFRIERDGPPRILVQSVERPAWDYAFQNAPHLLGTAPQVRQFDPVPRCGELYRFRLLANIVKNRSVPRADGSTRTTKAGLTITKRTRKPSPVRLTALSEVASDDNQERNVLQKARFEPWRTWLASMAHGFAVFDDEENPLRMQEVYTVVRNPKWQNPRRFNAGMFDGVITCTDAQQLADTIHNGIGPAKAFGFGLLSIAQVG
jgi:CRISPR system Cascade subunit CasE